MAKSEIKWLNEHNAAVQNAVLPLLDEDQDGAAKDWLKKACKPKKIWPWTGREE
jgi:Xaa-Pro aminopeptidase